MAGVFFLSGIVPYMLDSRCLHWLQASPIYGALDLGSPCCMSILGNGNVACFCSLQFILCLTRPWIWRQREYSSMAGFFLIYFLYFFKYFLLNSVHDRSSIESHFQST